MKTDTDLLIVKNNRDIIPQEERNNVSQLKLITGGKDGTPPYGETWLERLEIGSIFIIEDKQNPMDFNLGVFKLIGIEGYTRKAYILMAAGLPNPIHVNPIRFCNRYNLYEELCIVVEPETDKAPEEEPEDKNNG